MDGDEGLACLSAMSHHGSRSSGAMIPAKAFRFAQDTDEFKLLKKLVEGGKVKPSDRPSDIKDQFDIFKKIPANSFRSQFNKLKNLHGINTKSGKQLAMERAQRVLEHRDRRLILATNVFHLTH